MYTEVIYDMAQKFDLLSIKNEWFWGTCQQEAFKQELSSSPVLALYDTGKETMASADTSSFGILAVLAQNQSNH